MYGTEKKIDFEPRLNEDWATAQLSTINRDSMILTRFESMSLSVDEFLTILRTKVNYLKRLNDA